VAGERYVEVLADGVGAAKVIRMAMRQGDQARRPSSKLAKEATETPASARIDEHILREIAIDAIGRNARELKDAWAQACHC